MDGVPITMMNPTRAKKATQMMDGFIDDATKWTNCTPQITNHVQGTILIFRTQKNHNT